ncbi:AAA family ATPase [Tessaracoccus sp. G1721]
MSLLTSAQPLQACPRRVLVAGTSGSGKTTLASRIAGQQGIPHVEIDALSRPELGAEGVVSGRRVGAGGGEEWVTEWQRGSTTSLLIQVDAIEFVSSGDACWHLADWPT